MSVPLSPPKKNYKERQHNADLESKFASAMKKECVPGREDFVGEINPMMHHKRECLRHVLILGNSRVGRTEEASIGIMIAQGVLIDLCWGVRWQGGCQVHCQRIEDYWG